MKNIALILLTILSMSCQAQQKNKEAMKKVNQEKLLKYFKKIKKALRTLSKDKNDVKEIRYHIGHKDITYNIDEGTIQINNILPHPSKEFSENIGIFQYTIKKGYYKVTFWQGDTQILETGKYYPKMVADFINAAEELTTQQGTYKATMRLMKGNVLVFPDGLKIGLAYFSHKKTFENQRSPAIAHLELSNKQSKEKWFTIRRSEDTNEQGKFITTYESKKWKDYNIELTGLSYGEYIDIIVTKKSDKRLAINFMDITNELSIDEFEQIKNFILKNKGRQTYRNLDNDNPHYAFVDFDLYLGADIGPKKNSNNDPEISDFNDLTIRHNILAAPITYYNLVVVRKGDLNKGKVRILEGMKEDKVYLVDLYKVGLDELQKQLPSFLKTIRERIAGSK